MVASTFYTLGKTTNPKNPVNTVGKKFRTAHAVFSVTAAAANAGDLYVLADGLTFDDRIARLISSSPALTSASSCDLGFWYRKSDGTLAKIATGADTVLWSGVTLATALSYRDLLTYLNSALDTTKNIGQLLSLGVDAEPVGGTLLVLRLNNANTATGPLALDIDVQIEEASTR